MSSSKTTFDLKMSTIANTCQKGMTFYQKSSSFMINPKKTHTLRKEGSVLFNDALNTFYFWLYGIGHLEIQNEIGRERERENERHIWR